MTARFIKSRAPRLPLLAALLAAAPLFPPAAARANPISQPAEVLHAPQLPPFRWFASTDPERQNEDYILLKPGETRRVPLSSGKLIRLWSTASQPEKVVLWLSNGANTVLLRDNRAVIGSLHEKAYTLYPTTETPAAARNLKDGAALVVTNRDTKPNKWFYQAAVRTRVVDAPAVHGYTGQLRPEQSLAPGKQVTLFAATKPGMLRLLTIDVDGATAENLDDLRLRATWDAGAKQAVDVPLTALAGQFFDVRSSQSYGWEFRWRMAQARWDIKFPMPYGAGASMTLFNSGTSTVKVTANAGVDNRGGRDFPSAFRFCANYGSARTQNGRPLPMLRVLGSGAFVGLNLGIRPTDESGRRAFAYLEGNEIITTDGRAHEGTGAEDFFNSAWYFPDKAFDRPFHGLTFKQALPPQVSAYRLMIPDAVPFQKSLNFDFGHGSNNRGDDLEYRWVAFWYQKPPLNFEIADALRGDLTGVNSGESATGTPESASSPYRALIWLAPVAVFFVVISRVLRRRKTSS